VFFFGILTSSPLARVKISSVAGTRWLGGGADAAIVIKPCHIYEGDFLKIDKGIEVREIIAMPRIKFDKKLVEKMKKEGLEEAI